MKSTFTRALMAVLAIVWTISAQAVIQDNGDADGVIQIAPSCIVIDAPLEYVTVKTNFSILNYNEEDFYLIFNGEKRKFHTMETDRRDNLVIKFVFSEVSELVKGCLPEGKELIYLTLATGTGEDPQVDELVPYAEDSVFVNPIPWIE